MDASDTFWCCELKRRKKAIEDRGSTSVVAEKNPLKTHWVSLHQGWRTFGTPDVLDSNSQNP